MGAAADLDAPAGFTATSHPAHALLTPCRQGVAMITPGMRIRRHLRSVRASALSEGERRQELREAEARGAHDEGDEPAEPAASPRAVGHDGTPRSPEAGAQRAGVDEAA
jgi:hypothetical protein